MSVDFDWHIEEEDGPALLPDGQPQRSLPWGLFVLLLAAMTVVGGTVVAYRLHQSEMLLRAEVQEILDLAQQAVLSGDGELFFSLQSAESDWFSAQLRPENQAQFIAGLTVTHAEQHNDIIWANAQWQTADGIRQRVFFFRRSDDRLQQIATSSQFWGEQQTKLADWGLLKLPEADAVWAEAIRSFVADELANACNGRCDDHYPLVVTIRDDFAVTAAAHQLAVPSPRLIGLTVDGDPSPQFWQRLQTEMMSLAGPVTIRYAIPPQREQRVNYEAALAEFNNLHPEITVKLVEVEQFPEDPALLATLDGAAFAPSAAMIAAGSVFDLSGYVRTDSVFDQSDFYDAIWRGVRWRDRVWFLPQAATMRPVFYDTRAYAAANRLPPSMRWTWDELAADMEALVAAQPPDSWIDVAYLDTTLDTLYAYASNHEPACQTRNLAPCLAPLSAEAITTALVWYLTSTADPDHMADLTDILAPQRARVLTNWQSARRQSAIWVDEPVYYEHRLLLLPLGVTTFPGTDRFDGSAPLWVQGSFISAYSKQPRAVWTWLNFLSHTTPMQRYRLVPARRSVAHDYAYWETLPRELGEALRTAFPLARAVRIEERELFTWERLAQVVENGVDSAETSPPLYWFTTNP
ncbi:MAG: extracellular solute-binding protein [Anaerolineae bacterium]|nr:extracellular solute-binding protein [Anaerolineae bacterium]